MQCCMSGPGAGVRAAPRRSRPVSHHQSAPVTKQRAAPILSVSHHLRRADAANSLPVRPDGKQHWNGGGGALERRWMGGCCRRIQPLQRTVTALLVVMNTVIRRNYMVYRGSPPSRHGPANRGSAATPAHSRPQPPAQLAVNCEACREPGEALPQQQPASVTETDDSDSRGGRRPSDASPTLYLCRLSVI